MRVSLYPDPFTWSDFENKYRQIRPRQDSTSYCGGFSGRSVLFYGGDGGSQSGPGMGFWEMIDGCAVT